MRYMTGMPLPEQPEVAKAVAEFILGELAGLCRKQGHLTLNDFRVMISSSPDDEPEGSPEQEMGHRIKEELDKLGLKSSWENLIILLDVTTSEVLN